MKLSRIRSITKMGPFLGLFSFVCVLLVLSVPGFCNQAAETTKCSSLGSEELSSRELRLRLLHTAPLDPPCCAEKANLKGTIILQVTVSENGDISCVDQISGHPIIVTSAIHSVSKWKFKPYVAQGQRKPFHGKLAVKFRATERAVSFKVIDAP